MSEIPPELRDLDFDKLLEESVPISREMVERIRMLVQDVDIDLDDKIEDDVGL